MTEPEKVPHATVGHPMTKDQREALNAYSKTDIELWCPGTVLTAEMANRAIDWFNMMRGY